MWRFVAMFWKSLISLLSVTLRSDSFEIDITKQEVHLGFVQVHQSKSELKDNKLGEMLLLKQTGFTSIHRITWDVHCLSDKANHRERGTCWQGELHGKRWDVNPELVIQTLVTPVAFLLRLQSNSLARSSNTKHNHNSAEPFYMVQIIWQTRS